MESDCCCLWWWGVGLGLFSFLSCTATFTVPVCLSLRVESLWAKCANEKPQYLHPFAKISFQRQPETSAAARPRKIRFVEISSAAAYNIQFFFYCLFAGCWGSILCVTLIWTRPGGEVLRKILWVADGEWNDTALEHVNYCQTWFVG